VSRLLVAFLVSIAAGLAIGFACATPGSNKKGISQVCTKNLDCAYGLECVAAEGGSTAADTDAGPSRGPRACQYKSFGDCDVQAGDVDGGGTPAAAQTSGQQCLPGYRCRDGRCTVMCAGNTDCREGEVCRIGVCQQSGGRAGAQCYDKRDCPWPETCFYGQCVIRPEGGRCQSDLDCHSGFRCINGICQ
jgi:hypothetical protein